MKTEINNQIESKDEIDVTTTAVEKIIVPVFISKEKLELIEKHEKLKN
jgi:hypothetical protein